MRSSAVGMCLATVAALCIATSAPAAATHESVEAVWKPQQLVFEYRGHGTYYSCDRLHHKLRTILMAMGARENVRVHSHACDGLVNSARVEIVLESPILATADSIRVLTTYTTEQQLTARMRGVNLPSANDLARFPAAWRTVSLARSHTLRLESGDCELVEQLRQSILPLLSVQIVNDNVRCSPMGNTGTPRLTVLALVAEPRPAL